LKMASREEKKHEGRGTTESREIVKEKRTVIDERLIEEAIIENRKLNLDDTIAELKVETDVDLYEIDELSLTHEKIYKISNLEGYDKLRKLVLNSNIIEKIEGLDSLVNLEWLDLSFNNISRIEGLDNLVNLKDLSLHRNKISKIEGLDNLTKLQILSIGSNQISSMAVFQDLRRYKSLRVLSLKGNPVSKNDSYIASVIAFLPHVEFLDYKYLQPTQEQKDYHPSELDTLLKEEKKKAEEEKVQKEKKATADKDDTMNVIGLRSLYSDMMATDKSYKETLVTLQDLAGFKQEVMGKYKREFEKVVAEYLKQCEHLHEQKVEEQKRFQKALENADAKSKGISVRIIQEFEQKKEKAIQEFMAEEDESILKDLSVEVESLAKRLMENEMLLVEQLGDLFDEFNSQLRKQKEASNASRGDFSMRITDIVQGYKTRLQEFVDKERERIEEDEDEDEDEDEVEEVVKLIKHDEKLKEAINGSFETHKDFIEELIAALTKKEEDRIKSLQIKFQHANYNKNRERVAEIFDVVELYRKVIQMCKEEDAEDIEEDEDD